MKNWKLIGLRFFLTVVVLGNVTLLYYFYVNPEAGVELYTGGALELDNLHSTLGILFSAAILGYTLAPVLGIIDPIKYRHMVLMITFFHVLVTLADVQILMQGLASNEVVVPQMFYDTLITLGLLFFYPYQSRTRSS